MAVNWEHPRERRLSDSRRCTGEEQERAAAADWEARKAAILQRFTASGSIAVTASLDVVTHPGGRPGSPVSSSARGPFRPWQGLGFASCRCQQVRCKGPQPCASLKLRLQGVDHIVRPWSLFALEMAAPCAPLCCCPWLLCDSPLLGCCSRARSPECGAAARAAGPPPAGGPGGLMPGGGVRRGGASARAQR